MSFFSLAYPAAALALLLTSCISVTTVRDVAKYPSAKGQRYFLPQVYLVGRPAKDGSIEFSKFIARDETKEYAVHTWTLFGTYNSDLQYGDAPGVLSKISTSQASDAFAEKFVTEAGNVATAKIQADAEQEKALDSAIKEAAKNVRDKELAVEKARIALEGGAEADKPELQVALDQALADWNAAKNELSRTTGVRPKISGANIDGSKPPGKSPYPEAYTPIVYRVDDDGEGNINLVPVPYKTFAKTAGSKGGIDDKREIVNQALVGTSEVKKADDPPIQPFIGISTDLIPRLADGKVSQKPLEIITNTECKDPKITEFLKLPADLHDEGIPVPHDLYPTVTAKDSKHFRLRFKPETAAGDYQFNVTLEPLKGEKASRVVKITVAP